MGDMNFSLTTFDKSGKLLQIEYALNRVNQGKMALGVKGTKVFDAFSFLIYERFLQRAMEW
jgi:hypothetical protein